MASSPGGFILWTPPNRGLRLAAYGLLGKLVPSDVGVMDRVVTGMSGAEEFMAWLTRHRHETGTINRFSTKRMRSLMQRAQRDAGLEATGNVHLLRHSFCTHLAMAGKPPTVIQELAGHKHLTTTMRYMHVVKGAKEDAIQALNRPLPTGLGPTETPIQAVGLGRILEARPRK